ncbi:hypothetical protein N7478_002345 [Penicillium angulare]|uniref:uncharacterized protein n=1 Tax=Penicillium angulare TaxID=116970 RepID=UPI002542500A|nr:uncharacterized protein N7478_002345 [Penicillium angulare]KAJ5286659.1 hypothetical protein N7478_002345 [Penicillium angulare]
MKFVFINVKEPKDALQLAKDSEVRSHITRYQWQQYTDRNKSKPKPKRPPHTAEQISPLTSQNVNLTDSPDTSESDSSLVSLNQISLSPQIGGLRVDPFQSYPVSTQTWTPLLVDHYLIHMAVDIPELDQPGNRGLLRTSWFPLVMTEPALFSVIMLLAASHYASLQEKPSTMKMNLLGLRSEAIISINNCLEHHHGPDFIHDALIGAIAKMASYEAMFGSLENYNIHMQGLERIIGMRGGLNALGLNGLLHRIVVWIDRNAAFLHGSAMYFPHATFVSAPNPGHFLGSS